MRIVIATATAGAGHLQAAAALEEAWKAERPGDSVRTVDVLDFTPGFYKKAYSSGYAEIVKRAPELYAAFFRRTDDPAWVAKLTKLKRRLGRLSAPGFARLIRSFRPHAVVATHFLPPEILGDLAEQGGDYAPRVACVVTATTLMAMTLAHSTSSVAPMLIFRASETGYFSTLAR